MAKFTQDELAKFVAERLSVRADEIVESWVEWVRAQVDNPSVDALPYKALLNHIPPVVQALTKYLRTPTSATHEEMLGHLKIHGQIRRDQGYEATDIMSEFDGLSHMILAAMREEIESQDSRIPASVALQVFGRLADGLRAMSYVTLAVYHQTASERHQELAHRLADFGHAIGHELRNPLDTIAISADLLENPENPEDSEPPAAARHIDLIKRSLAHARGLIDDIEVLSFAQDVDSKSRMASLPQLLGDLRHQLHPQAATRQVSIEVVSEIPRVAVEALVGSLALVNVVNNAVKYCDPDKDDRWVRVSAAMVDGEDTPIVEIRVEDNGIGIPDDMHTRVFQRGFRAHPDHAEGTGLGLAIAQELLIDRGGRIDLESEEREGTTVRIRMRAIDAEPVNRLSEHLGSIMSRSIRLGLSPPSP